MSQALYVQLLFTKTVLENVKPYAKHLPTCERYRKCKHCSDPVFWHSRHTKHNFEWETRCTCGLDDALAGKGLLA